MELVVRELILRSALLFRVEDGSTTMMTNGGTNEMEMSCNDHTK
jgi:hypothetical protein